MSKASSSQKVTLKRGDGAGPEVFTLIAEITSWTGPTETAKQIDVSSVDSDAREFIAGLRDPGEMAIEGNFVAEDVGQAGLRADLASRAIRNFELTLADATATLMVPTKISFTAVVTSFQIKGAVDDKVAFSASVKITGVPTYTPRAAGGGG